MYIQKYVTFCYLLNSYTFTKRGNKLASAHDLFALPINLVLLQKNEIFKQMHFFELLNHI